VPESRELNRHRLSRPKQPARRPWLPRALAGAFLVLAPLLAVGAVSPQAVAAADPLPTLTTDKADYSPSETVHISGSSFAPLLAYDIVVIRPDGSIIKGDGNFNPDGTYTCPGGAAECWDTVTADASGSFTYAYVLDGIAGDYEVRAYASPWTGDRSLAALATTTFTDGNVKFDVAPTGTTAQFVETLYSTSTNCTGTVKNNFPKTLDNSNGDSVGVGSSESLRLDAAATSDQGGTFIAWSTTDSPASPFTVISGTGGKSICIPGFQGNGTRNYRATYAAAPPATTAQFVVNKDFVPNNAADVTVALSCTSGTVANDDTTASESDPANFTVTGFSAGATCTATETVPAGYSPNQADCANKAITAGATTSCTIVNTDIAPTVTLSKAASPTTRPEPGGLFTFTLTITNTSGATDTVTITSLTDSQSGAADASNDFADCAALVGTTLAPGASASCSYAVAHTQPGSYSNTASVSVSDEEASTASAGDGETVTVTNVAPAISVDKTVSPTSVSEGGVGSQSVTYTFTVTNTSTASTDPVTITSLTDSVLGPLAGDADCHVGTVLAFGASCTFDVITTVPAKNAGATQDNTFTATANDDEGNPANDSDGASVSYSNVAPSISSFTCSTPINEGGSTTCTATFSGGGSSDSYTCVFSWGTGEGTSTVPVAAGGTSCTASHMYVDDNPTGTASDTYVVGVTVTDDEGTSDSENANVTVNNVAPVVTATIPSTAFVNFIYSVSGSCTDVGVHDTWTATIDWGDFTSTGPFAVTCNNGTFTRTHTYSAAGTYTVNVTVCDDDLGCDTESSQVTVQPGLNGLGSGTTLTDSAFQIGDSLTPLLDFEILKAKDNTVITTNPGQFYMHGRVQNVTGSTQPVHMVLDWDDNFITQGAIPVHCYIRPPSGGWSETPCTITLQSGSVVVDFAAVPANYTVWVTVHLDYKWKGSVDPNMTPKSFTFTTSWTVGPLAGSDTETLVGYAKKTTVMYGYVLDPSGAPISGAQVKVTRNGVTYTYTTGTDGLYVFYDGQTCSGDGVTCSGGSANLSLPNANYTLTIVAPAGWSTSSSSCVTSTTATVNVNAQGKAFRKDWKLYANSSCP
jgi:hypothetical protein